LKGISPPPAAERPIGASCGDSLVSPKQLFLYRFFLSDECRGSHGAPARKLLYGGYRRLGEELIYEHKKSERIFFHKFNLLHYFIRH
jgi:hypothetical protein